jgi:SNF2 family DNA or RNA helicase
MARLEDLTRGASVKGVLPDGLVTVVDVKWIGTIAIELTYKGSTGRLGNELLYRDREPTLEVVTTGRPWSFDGDGGMFRLVSEAHRIGLAYLFDPLLAVHTSLVEPLPHQITAVYQEMLPRQPLRYLLAEDPGSGKTIMTGPYLNYRPLSQEELPLLPQLPEPPWLRDEIESKVLEYAALNLVPTHLDELRRRKETLVALPKR